MRWHIWSMLVVVSLVLPGSIRADESAPAGEEPIYQGKTLAEWIADLKDPKLEIQRTAAQALGKFGLKAKEALPELHAAYKRLSAGPPALKGDKKYSETYLKIFADARRAVAEALILIDDHPGPELAPILLEALKTADVEKRRDIVIQLGKLGPAAAKATVPALVGVLKETDDASWGALVEIRLEAIKSLGRIGPAANPALHALTMALKLAAPAKKDARVQQLEVSDKIVGSSGAKARIISFAIPADDKAMLLACAEALGRIRPQAKGTIGALRLALRDMDEGVRWAAFCALLQSRQESKELVPILLNFVHNEDASFRRVAVQALGKSGSEGKEMIPALTASLKDEDPSVRASAAEALSYLGPKAQTAVPALIAALKDAEWHEGKALVKALRKIGIENKEAILDFVAALQEKSWGVNGIPSMAQIKVGPQVKAAVPRLLALLRDSKPMKQLIICFVLASIGPPAKDAITSLEKVAKHDPTEFVRLAAYTALVRIDHSRFEDYVPRLVAVLERDIEKDGHLIEVAGEGLFLIGREDPKVLSYLGRLRDKTSEAQRREAIEALVKAIQHPETDISDLVDPDR